LRKQTSNSARYSSLFFLNSPRVATNRVTTCVSHSPPHIFSVFFYRQIMCKQKNSLSHHYLDHLVAKHSPINRGDAAPVFSFKRGRRARRFLFSQTPKSDATHFIKKRGTFKYTIKKSNIYLYLNMQLFGVWRRWFFIFLFILCIFLSRPFARKTEILACVIFFILT